MSEDDDIAIEAEVVKGVKGPAFILAEDGVAIGGVQVKPGAIAGEDEEHSRIEVFDGRVALLASVANDQNDITVLVAVEVAGNIANDPVTRGDKGGRGRRAAWDVRLLGPKGGRG